MPKWEYTVAFKNPNDGVATLWQDKTWDKQNKWSIFDWLQEMGRQCWELVSIETFTTSVDGLVVMYTLKRPIES